MALIEVSNYLNEIFGEFSYVAPFAVLILCGLGLPIPEEVTLIGAGFLLYQGKVDAIPITAVCSVAILLGDSIPYWLGRRFGISAVKSRLVRRFLHPERFSRVERRFKAHGNWATFVCRFLAGVRIPGYFVAGTMGMTYPRFLLLDGLGVLISVPASIYIGQLFGGQVEKLKGSMEDLHLYLGFGVVAMILILVIRSRRSRIALKEARDRERAARLEAARVAEQKLNPDTGRPDGSGV